MHVCKRWRAIGRALVSYISQICNTLLENREVNIITISSGIGDHNHNPTRTSVPRSTMSYCSPGQLHYTRSELTRGG